MLSPLLLKALFLCSCPSVCLSQTLSFRNATFEHGFDCSEGGLDVSYDGLEMLQKPINGIKDSAQRAFHAVESFQRLLVECALVD